MDWLLHFLKTHIRKDIPDEQIFIVEDNEDNGYILEFYLTEERLDVRLFRTITDFKNMYPAALPDIFLLDVMLPDGNGIILCNEIKSNSKANGISG